MKNKIIDYLDNKKILILGFGREGKSAYKFIKDNLKNYKLGIADINEINIDDDSVKLHIGENYLESTKEYDLVIKSPGIIIKDYITDIEKQKITSLTDLFLRFCDNTIIGVTGTKGKSTTASLIHHILVSCGKKSLLIGNIGIPAFSVLEELEKDTILVYELSCHQLEYITKSPHISILLNLYEEHLDHYVGIEGYIRSKTNIYRYQTENDYLIYGDIWKYIDKKEFSKIKSKLIDINNNDLNINYEDIETSLVGDHNKKNIITALLAVRLVGINIEEGLKSVKTFKPLEHRMEFVGEYKKIKFYNDSIATAQEAVINAVKSLKDVDTIIIGGMDRGLDYTLLVEFLSTSSVNNIILLPSTNSRIEKMFNDYKINKNIICVNNMDEAVKMSYKYTKPNKICLLSPAAASYGFYLNFEKRGEHFKDLVKYYANNR